MPYVCVMFVKNDLASNITIITYGLNFGPLFMFSIIPKKSGVPEDMSCVKLLYLLNNDWLM